MSDSEDSRCHIMESTLETLTEEGYHNLSFSKIAERAEVSKSLISYHFDTKEELISELFEWLSGETLEKKREDDRKDFVALVDLLLPEDEEGRRIQKSILEIGASSSSNEKLQESYREMNKELKENIRDSKDSELDKDKADIFLTILTGAAFRREMLGEDIDADAIKNFMREYNG